MTTIIVKITETRTFPNSCVTICLPIVNSEIEHDLQAIMVWRPREMLITVTCGAFADSTQTNKQTNPRCATAHIAAERIVGMECVALHRNNASIQCTLCGLLQHVPLTAPKFALTHYLTTALKTLFVFRHEVAAWFGMPWFKQETYGKALPLLKNGLVMLIESVAFE